MNFTASSQRMDWSDIELPFDESFDDDNETVAFAETENDESDAENPNVVVKRGRKQFITSRLASALDNAKVSSGMAVHILIAAAEALGHRVEELVINRKTIHSFRQQNREKESSEIQADFIDNVIFKCQTKYSEIFVLISNYF